MIEVKSVMLFSVGMYLPLGTTFAIFVGGVIRWITDKLRDRRGFNDAQKARVDNAGVLTASGLIAGEALCGLVIAGLVGSGHDVTLLKWTPPFLVALGRAGHTGDRHDSRAASQLQDVRKIPRRRRRSCRYVDHEGHPSASLRASSGTEGSKFSFVILRVLRG